MGHTVEIKKEYRDLQQRVDANPVGAPATKDIFDILQLLFTEEEAVIATKMPMKPATIGTIAARTGYDKKKLEKILIDMSFRGLMMDFTNKKTGKTVYILPPTVVGFFEFSMMRRRDDMPQKSIAEAMDRYFGGSDVFAREVFREDTQIGRTLVHETALSPGDASEIFSWERASAVIEDASKHSVSLCYCLHKEQHLGRGCDKPEEICFALGTGADLLVRKKLAREISKSEMLDLLEVGREHGLVHIADNVKNEPTFICNCCGCCCEMLGAINHHGIKKAVHTSGFIATVDLDSCIGCGKCAKRCPINAITIREEKGENGKKKKWAEVDKSICLGCGVCERACKKFDAISMKKRKGKRILTPENTLDRIITQAIERGKLQNFIFDGADDKGDFLKNLFGAILKMPASKRLLLNKEIKSRFIAAISGKTSF